APPPPPPPLTRAQKKKQHPNILGESFYAGTTPAAGALCHCIADTLVLHFSHQLSLNFNILVYMEVLLCLVKLAN
ncbi:MAG: hypothetical protein ABF687_10540, partial [Lentilactobacillus diolivorans]